MKSDRCTEHNAGLPHMNIFSDKYVLQYYKIKILNPTDVKSPGYGGADCEFICGLSTMKINVLTHPHCIQGPAVYD